MRAQVVAIMGPSGAGKSTLLYALMGTARYGAARGRLWVNGREMRLARLRRILGYVPQARSSHSASSNSTPTKLYAFGRCYDLQGPPAGMAQAHRGVARLG